MGSAAVADPSRAGAVHFAKHNPCLSSSGGGGMFILPCDVIGELRGELRGELYIGLIE